MGFFKWKICEFLYLPSPPQALEKEVKEFLTELSGKTPATQVNEVASFIRIKGYFDEELKQWLMDKGF